MISGTAIASTLADCLEESLTAGPHVQSALKGKNELLSPTFWGRKGHLIRLRRKPSACCYAGLE